LLEKKPGGRKILDPEKTNYAKILAVEEVEKTQRGSAPTRRMEKENKLKKDRFEEKEPTKRWIEKETAPEHKRATKDQLFGGP